MPVDVPGADAPGGDRERSTSSSLLEGAKRGDDQAWKRLVAVYAWITYTRCRRDGLGPDDALDVVQEVFSSVAAHIREFRYRTPSDRFRSWLKAITSHKIADHFRRLNGQPRAEGGSEAQQRLADVPAVTQTPLASDEGAAVIDPDLHGAVEIVKASVEASTWRAFWCLTVDERSAADVAAELGMTAKAVYQAKYRVTQLLRKETHRPP